MALRLDKSGCPSRCSGEQYASGEYATIGEDYGYGRVEARMKVAKGEGLVTSLFTYYDLNRIRTRKRMTKLILKFSEKIRRNWRPTIIRPETGITARSLILASMHRWTSMTMLLNGRRPRSNGMSTASWCIPRTVPADHCRAIRAALWSTSGQARAMLPKLGRGNSFIPGPRFGRTMTGSSIPRRNSGPVRIKPCAGSSWRRSFFIP